MPIDIAPLLLPISDDAPGGQDVRDTDAYDALSGEIEKLTHPSASGQTDWQRVVALGAPLLSGQGKDFLVAAWVAAGWLKLDGVDGIAAGLQLLDGLTRQYWDCAFPPEKRRRGRYNALDWWAERTADWLEAAELAPLAADVHEALMQQARSLDEGLAERDPDAPSIQSLIQRLNRLEVVAPVAAPEPAAPESAGHAPDAANGASSAENPVPASTLAATPSAQAAAQRADGSTAADGAVTARAAAHGPVAGAAPAAPAAFQAPDTPPDAAFETPEAVVAAMAPALQYLGRMANTLRTLSPDSLLALALSRLAARGPLLNRPPASADGTTAIPAPPVAILDAFASVRDSANANGLIEFCESRIITLPYWLDLDRESARGFALLGPGGAALQAAVSDHALRFVDRLPGIEALRFADGTPFADEATQAWLAESRQARAAGASDGAGDPLIETRQAAQAALAQGHADQARDLYRQLLNHSRSTRTQFQARIALVELHFKQSAPAASDLAMTRGLIQDCRRHKLARWEPDLALQAWILHRHAARRTLESAEGTQDTALREACTEALHKAAGKIAALDPCAVH